MRLFDQQLKFLHCKRKTHVFHFVWYVKWNTDILVEFEPSMIKGESAGAISGTNHISVPIKNETYRFNLIELTTFFLA